MAAPPADAALLKRYLRPKRVILVVAINVVEGVPLLLGGLASSVVLLVDTGALSGLLRVFGVIALVSVALPGGVLLATALRLWKGTQDRRVWALGIHAFITIGAVFLIGNVIVNGGDLLGVLALLAIPALSVTAFVILSTRPMRVWTAA